MKPKPRPTRVSKPEGPKPTGPRTFIRAVNGRLVTDMLKGKQEVPK